MTHVRTPYANYITAPQRAKMYFNALIMYYVYYDVSQICIVTNVVMYRGNMYFNITKGTVLQSQYSV